MPLLLGPLKRIRPSRAAVRRSLSAAATALFRMAATSLPKLVVSGAHHPAFEAICDVLEKELTAERLVLPGYGHVVQLHPEFNFLLADFVERAATASPTMQEIPATLGPL